MNFSQLAPYLNKEEDAWSSLQTGAKAMNKFKR
jgi:hypothetical protein